MLKFAEKIPTRRSKIFFLGFEGRNFNNFFRILRTLGFFSYLVKRSHFVSPTAWYSHLAMLGNFKFGLGPLKDIYKRIFACGAQDFRHLSSSSQFFLSSRKLVNFKKTSKFYFSIKTKQVINT